MKIITVQHDVPIPLAVRSGMGLKPLDGWDRGFESH